jgi:hypothetical protein
MTEKHTSKKKRERVSRTRERKPKERKPKERKPKERKTREKKPKRETKSQKEKKEIKKLDKEIEEVNLEIKKISLNNKKIIPMYEEETKGLTSIDSGLDFTESQASLEMVNEPRGRLVPLERTLRVETPSPSILDNNKDSNEFNPFQYSSGNENSNSQGSQYIKEFDSGYSEHVQALKRTDTRDLAINPHERQELGFTPMYDHKSTNPEKTNIAKKVDINELGKERPHSKKEIKYTPSGY